MPFKQRFERKFNRNMQQGLQGGPAPRQSEDRDHDLKKCYQSPRPEDDDADDEYMDAEKDSKRDRPPRFSTLFGAAPSPPPPLPPVQYIERPARRRRSGVTMPMPLFVLFMVILFFESTILFAYTVLGLYNNAPSQLFGLTNSSHCQASSQPLVNISPNFVLPQAPQAAPISPWSGGSNAGIGPNVITTTFTVTTSATTTTTSITTTSATSTTTTTATTTATTTDSSITSPTSTSSTTSTSTSSPTTSSSTSTTSTTSSSSTITPSPSTVLVTDWTNPSTTVTSVVVATGPPPVTTSAG